VTDFHHNIFYYYRGPQQANPEQYDQQLEDNTTKALANTLRYCAPIVALKFLEWLEITASGNIEVELQKSTIGTEKIRRTSQRLLLGIVAVPENKEDPILSKLKGLATGDSRPDAWIYGEDFVVLIESKVGNASLELNQMRSHFQKLQKDTSRPVECKVQTWAEIHKFFTSLISVLTDKDKWLVEQFTQYLEYKNMSEFSGFEETMFEFFVHTEKDSDIKQWIRSTMDLLGKEILLKPNGLQSLNKSFYTMHHVGNFGAKDDHFWVAFGPKEFGNYAHQTISLYDYGLDVFANIELAPAIKKLREKIRNEKPRFREIVSELPEPFSVCIEERKNKQASIYNYYPIATLEAGVRKFPNLERYGLKDPKSNGFDYLEILLEQIQFPYVFLRKRIKRMQLLELSSKGNADALVDQVLTIMRNFQPLVEFING
jgi:hypothetical protein